MAMAIERPRANRRWLLWLVAALALVGILSLFIEDWGQLWKITSAADNIPIVAMIPLVAFFTWLGIRQSKNNDQLIERLEGDPPARVHEPVVADEERPAGVDEWSLVHCLGPWGVRSATVLAQV